MTLIGRALVFNIPIPYRQRHATPHGGPGGWSMRADMDPDALRSAVDTYV